MKEHEIIRRATSAMLNMELAERGWARVLMNSRQNGFDMKRFLKREIDTIEYPPEIREFVKTMAVSRYLAGGKRNITKERLPKKYKFEVLLLYYFVYKWKLIIDNNDYNTDLPLHMFK